MAEFGLVVEFEIQPENLDAFLLLIEENARQSVALEPGCKQFDVLQAQGQPNRIMLYEIYADEAAFQAHTKMPHVAAFFAKGKPLIAKQMAHRLQRRLAASKP